MFLEQDQPPADRVDRHVEPAVVVVVGDGEAAAEHLREPGCAGVRERPRRPFGGVILEQLDRLGVPGQVGDGNRAVREDEVGIAVEVEVGPRGPPAREGAAERGGEPRPPVGEGRPVPPRRQAVQDGVLLAAGVADEEIGQPVPVGVGVRDAHACVRIGGAGAAGSLLEAEAEPGGVCLRATGPGDVLVEPIRILVVRDVEVEPAVPVEVGEDRSEAVVEPGGFEARLTTDLAEAAAAQVEVEQVAHARVIAREARARPCDRSVQVGVATDEEIRTPVPVDVADRSRASPAASVDAGRGRPLAEPAVALVPEQRGPAGRGDVEIGVAVAVEIRSDTAHPPQGEVRARPPADVDELPLHVPEEGAPGQAAAPLPPWCVALGVGVDDEEVEPAVAVVVEPAEAAAHHRHGIGGDPEAKCAVTKVEPACLRDVGEPNALRSRSRARHEDGDPGEHGRRDEEESLHPGKGTQLFAAVSKLPRWIPEPSSRRKQWTS